MYKIRGKIGKKNDDDTVAALGYIFRGGQWEDVFRVLKKKSESCGLHDFFIIKFFIIRTNKRIKDEKCYI